MRFFNSIVASACLTASAQVFAQDKCNWDSWGEMAQFLGENSPEINVLKVEEQARTSAVDVANLSPPSIINGQYTAGDLPWKSSNLEASYLWTIESQGKKNARLSAARANAETIKFSIDDVRASQILKLALVQQALKRSEAQLEVLSETRATYSKIIKQFTSRLTLGPEQEASLAVFKIAKKENDLKIEAIDVERSQLIASVSALTGCRNLTLPRNAKSLNTKNPLLESETNNSTAIRKLEAEAKSLQLSIESDIQSYAYDLNIGPVIIADRSDDQNRLEVGLAASIPIGGSRQSVLTSSRRAEFLSKQAEANLNISRLQIERAGWVSQYEKSLKALKGGLSRSEVSALHHKLERLFQGERVSAALVIESHRQLLEHTSTVTDLESKATEAALNIRYLDGTLSWSDL